MPTIDYGIDLGTTNSSVACCRNAAVKIFQTTELQTITPSVVYIGKSGRMLVGKRAYDTWISDPENTQAEFKRWMGFSDKLLFPASNRTMTAEELSAEVLKSLRADVQRTNGEELAAAVITVPAAFGNLQCDATARAARLAGFQHAPLLQEPIAAAIAYGASATSSAQRWLVFDLGGGTLDVAVVSTRNGRLAVLENQGNNRLGGKDMDRVLAENLLMEPLSHRFKLPDKNDQPTQYNRLLRHLIRIAEHAKIALSTTDVTTVEIFNVGEDLQSNPIEAAFTITRPELEKQIEPLLTKSLDLVQRALDGARISPKDLDRVLLVGGPTQMPAVRSLLKSALGDKLDHSIDPMTVVAQGAAIYASSLQNEAAASTATISAPTQAPASPDAIPLQLNHEHASGTPKSPVAGSFSGKSRLFVHEIKIDAEGGFWSSGWLPITADRFATEVLLTPNKPATSYKISARTRSGQLLPITPDQFSIAFMLPMGAIPLPHTIAIELATDSGKDAFVPIFTRHTPLPAETRKTFRTERTVRPSDIGEALPIKFWEIEVSEDPDEKWWTGCIKIAADRLKRPLPEGSEIELTIKIDKSRKITVDCFIPSLNQFFSNDVYIPDPPSTRNQLQAQIDLCFDRMNRIFQFIYAAGRDELAEQAREIQAQLENIAEHIEHAKQQTNPDPDALLEHNDHLRKIRIQITQLEEQLETEKNLSPLILDAKANLRWARTCAQRYGTQRDVDAVNNFAGQLDRYIDAQDFRGIKFVREQINELTASLVAYQRQHYEEWLADYSSPSARFINQEQAKIYLDKAKAASANNDFPALKDAIDNLHSLRPKDSLKAAEDQSKRSGLKET